MYIIYSLLCSSYALSLLFISIFSLYKCLLNDHVVLFSGFQWFGPTCDTCLLNDHVVLFSEFQWFGPTCDTCLIEHCSVICDIGLYDCGQGFWNESTRDGSIKSNDIFFARQLYLKTFDNAFRACFLFYKNNIMIHTYLYRVLYTIQTNIHCL